jgi:hypothetical protein
MEKLKKLKDLYMDLSKRGKLLVIACIVIAVVIVVGYF